MAFFQNGRINAIVCIAARLFQRSSKCFNISRTAPSATLRYRSINTCRKPASCGVAVLVTSLASVAHGATLDLGPFDQGVYSGTPPFNTSGDCSQAGDDCSDEDTRVRSADLISFSWSVVATGIARGEADLASVMFEQTLRPAEGATVQIDEIPISCRAHPDGPGGAEPVSEIITHADGSVTLQCNLGPMGNGEQKSFTVSVRPLGDSPDGSNFSTSQKVYALDADGVRIVEEASHEDPSIYTISSSPAWDLIGDRVEMHIGGVTVDDVGTGRGPEQGFYLWTTAHLAADANRLGKGVSSLTNSFQFNANVTATRGDGVTPFAFEYKVSSCEPNATESALAVWGNESIRTDRAADEHVVDSGTCNISGDALQGWTLSANNVDTSGTRFPEKTINGTSLAAGPYFQMAYRIRIFIPFSEIDREDPTPSSGQLRLTHCLTDFDPVDLTGISNYGTDYEDGYNGRVMPDGSASNNCTGPTSVQFAQDGIYYFRVADQTNDAGEVVTNELGSGLHSGEGLAEPGVAWPYMNFIGNTGSVPMSGLTICTKFDNTTQKLSQRESVGGSAGAYAWVAARQGALAADWQVEYASASLSGDDPLDGNADGENDFNPLSGRFEGNWSQLKNTDCNDPSLQWNTDPQQTGIDSINLVRVRPVNPVHALQVGEQLNLLVPVEARDQFEGGPHAGSSMPPGVVMAGIGTWRSNDSGEWRPSAYVPAPESSHWDGDRVTFTRIRVDVAKSTILPVAAPGTSVSSLAGNPVVWHLDPVVSSMLLLGGQADNAFVSDVLPAELTYDQSCTLEQDNGRVPTSVLPDTPAPGQTTLLWSLGSPHSTDVLDPIVFCTATNPTTPSGTAVVNTATINADNAVPSPPAYQTVVLGQAGNLRAVATVSDFTARQDGAQTHSLQWFNFSKTGVVLAPTVINVLPYATGNPDAGRPDANDPASSFSGQVILESEPDLKWSDGSQPTADDPFESLANLYYTADPAPTVALDPDTNNSNWCQLSGSRFVNPSVAGGLCPITLADVTAIKAVSNFDLESNGHPRQGVNMSYTLLTSGNEIADHYTNRFGIDTPSLPSDQYVLSRGSDLRIEDNDGIPASVEFGTGGIGAPVDSDGDGIADYMDSDSDGDGLPDALEVGSILTEPLDSDGDGLADYLDTDSDNNGISDSREAALSGSDNDADGIADEFDVDNTLGADSDRNDIDDEADTSGLLDTDADGVADFRDMDNDGDLIVDTIEADITDLDHDGFADNLIDSTESPNATEMPDDSIGGILPDTDIDGIPDLLDTDSDGDGISDFDENRFVANAPGTNGSNGSNAASVSAAATDTDEDGIANFRDLDSDNDSIPDHLEVSVALSGNPGATDGAGVSDGTGAQSESSLAEPRDTDADDIPDFLDLDSDQDGVTDLARAGLDDVDEDGVVDNFTDINQDGVSDNLALIASDADNDGISDLVEGSVDSDGDGTPDYLDGDSDQDGVPDALEFLTGPTDSGGLQNPVDSDADGVPDYLDRDSDNDGIPDSYEAGSSLLDHDGDGIDDSFDSDLTTGDDINQNGIDDNAESTGSRDDDQDGLGNLRDRDSDNDGLSDLLETGGVDLDNDGIVDTLVDANGDGMDDGAFALTSAAAEPDYPDTDGDGVADYLDLDSDNDGVPDSYEGTVAAPDIGGTPGAAFPPLGAMVADTDSDGTPDYLDSDSNDDGVSDLVEAGLPDADSDGQVDGFVDRNLDGADDRDLASIADRDNDGIPDSVEIAAAVGSGDTDGDGAPDHLDRDSDNDGLPDALEFPARQTHAEAQPEPLDSDADGLADYLDRDSDNDGLSDIVETGGTDLDNDGVVETLVDTDGDGMDDNSAAATGAGSEPEYPDTDGDGVADYLDLDSDNDGVLDADEGTVAGSATTGGTTGSVSKPLGASVVDTDGDGTPDYLDPDRDGDGVSDLMEAGLPDVDGDGQVDGFTDSNGDGADDRDLANLVAANADDDSDSDGIPDVLEIAAAGVSGDTDGDGVPDHIDRDSDNDGIPDALEILPNLPNIAGGQTPVDSDADGLADYLDRDLDSDGLSDTLETGGADSNNDGIIDNFIDADQDGLHDAVAAALGSYPAGSYPDSDADGVPDYRDLDSDNDGILDRDEATVAGSPGLQPSQTPELGAAVADTDGDGVADYLDPDSNDNGIPDLVESGQPDVDGDGRLDGFVDADGNGADDRNPASTADSDADGLSDTLEISAAGVTGDTDGDGVADHLDGDSDNDGVSDGLEALGSYAGGNSGNADATTPTAWPADSDGDGTPDYLDLDSDNDGIYDITQAGNQDADGDGLVDNYSDNNRDGIADHIETLLVDTDADGIPDTLDGNLDIDNDGLPNYLDEDSDADGIPDSVEGRRVAGLLADSDQDLIPDFQDRDSDGDTLSDLLEGLADSDRDGTPDRLDLDSDNDGVLDLVETHGSTRVAGVLDGNQDGRLDPEFSRPVTQGEVTTGAQNEGAYDLVSHAYLMPLILDALAGSGNDEVDPENPADLWSADYNTLAEPPIGPGYLWPIDTDGDGIHDYRDLDSDNDGVPDSLESGHMDSEPDGQVGDALDVLSPVWLAFDSNGLRPDVGQLPRNTDNDAVHDYRDTDSDNDGVMDAVEAYGAGSDADHDGVLDGFVDGNGDGMNDLWQADSKFPVDTDGDGFPDAHDHDADGDGLGDIYELVREDVDGDGMIDSFIDQNFDGVDDNVAVNPIFLIDVDEDGTPDFQDTDSDGDGTWDLIEAGAIDENSDQLADKLLRSGQIADINGDGIPDHLQPIALTPQAALLNDGPVRTGLSQGGCSISSSFYGSRSKASASVAEQGIDLILPLLAILSIIRLLFRSSFWRMSRRLLMALPGSLLLFGLAGCTVSDRQPAGVPSISGSSDRGFYAATALGFSTLKPDASESSSWQVGDTSHAGAHVAVGMDITRRTAVELHAARLGSAEVSSATEDDRIDYRLYGGSAVFYLGRPRMQSGRKGLAGFGRLGVAYLHNDATKDNVWYVQDHSTQFLLGAGMEYQTRRRLGLRAELVRYQEDAFNAQLGLIYRFGQDHRRKVIPPVAAVVSAEPVAVPEPEALLAAAVPADADKDGILDSVDKCQGTARQVSVDSTGCALFNGVVEGISFERNSSHLTSSAKLVLNEVREKLANFPEVNLVVTAHTSSWGDSDYNQLLSQRRATAVVTYLAEQGMPRSQLLSTAFGETKPIDTNETPEGRARNRRVELVARKAVAN